MCACYQHLLEALVHAPAFVCLHVSVCGKHVCKQQSGTACYVLVYVVEELAYSSSLLRATATLLE